MYWIALAKISIDSFKETLKSKFWKWFFGGPGGVFGILWIAKNLDSDTKGTASALIGLKWLLILFSIRYLSILFKNIIKYLNTIYRESTYRESIITLKFIFSNLRILRYKQFTDEEFMEKMKILCNELAGLFNKQNKSICSVSIKVPVNGVINTKSIIADCKVRNLIRDSTASDDRDVPKYISKEHTILGNTCYRKIVDNLLTKNFSKLHYINQNIPKSVEYDNTSKNTYGNGSLKYDSEIVVPIFPSIGEGDREYDILGFLCVDCKEINKFEEKYDIPLIAGVADGIYDILEKRNDLITNKLQ